jgi:RimJ/RimL family protein N-acetyltransferase
MEIPVLETERLRIRPFIMDDLAAIHQILDLELKWAGESLNLEDRKDVLQGNVWASRLEVPAGWRAIERREDARLIGMIRLHVDLLPAEVRDLFDEPGETDSGPFSTLEYHLTYALSSAYWGQRYATEAAGALVQFAFQRMKLRRILAETSEDNSRSLNVMRRLGMRLEAAPRPGWPDRVVGMLLNETRG